MAHQARESQAVRALTRGERGGRRQLADKIERQHDSRRRPTVGPDHTTPIRCPLPSSGSARLPRQRRPETNHATARPGSRPRLARLPYAARRGRPARRRAGTASRSCGPAPAERGHGRLAFVYNDRYGTEATVGGWVVVAARPDSQRRSVRATRPPGSSRSRRRGTQPRRCRTPCSSRSRSRKPCPSHLA